jgi:hypothetical protein
MDMSISSLAVNAASIDSGSTIGLAMVKKSLEFMDMEGDNMRQMLEASVTPQLGQNIDYLV